MFRSLNPLRLDIDRGDPEQERGFTAPQVVEMQRRAESMHSERQPLSTNTASVSRSPRAR